MHIVVLGMRGFPNIQGGIEKHCEELYPRLVRLGCVLTVLVRHPYVQSECMRSEWKGVHSISLWCPRQRSLEAITHTFLGIFKARLLSPDILHIHAVGPSLLIPLAKILGLKVIMTHHGPDYERLKWGSLAKGVLRLGEKLGVKFSDRIIVVSRGIKEGVKASFGKEAIFIPNGVVVPNPLPPGDELKRWNLTPHKYIFTACRFVPEKGLHDLISAYRSIARPPFNLVIAGDADHESKYSRTLKKLAAETKGVILTGFLSGERLAELFSNAGLFVLPSYYEGLPIALLEALSYGLPVLASDIPQHREIPLQGDFRYFHVGNIEELSDALVKAFERGLSEEEKNEYLSMLATHYNWDVIAQRTLEVYKDLCKLS